MEIKYEKNPILAALKRNRIITSLCAVALGVLFLVWADGSLALISKAIGVILMAGGIATAASHVLRKNLKIAGTFSLLGGVIIAVIGFWIFRNPDMLTGLIPTIVGVIVTISGVTDIFETLTLARQKYGRWWLSLIFAIATTALGLFLVFNPLAIAALLIRICGAVMIFDGASDLWIASRIDTVIRDAVQDSTVIDGEAVEIDEDKTE